jgi:hypothetical protein
VKNARRTRLVEEASEPRKKEKRNQRSSGVRGAIGGEMSLVFGEEREELREFLASCSSSAAISD